MLTNYYAVSEIASFSRKSINLDACTFLDYLDTGSITDGKIHNLTRYTDFTKLPSRARKSIIEGDILYSTVRPNNRHFGIIHSDCKDMVVSTGFSVIRADREKVLPDYLYYLLTGNSVIDLLESIAEQSVSTYPSINDSDIGDLEFEIPSLASQQVVVDIINSIDRKICNNEKINDNLQAIAYSKYNHLKRSCVDQVSLSDIAEVCYGKDHKSLSNGSIPVYGSGGIMRFVERPLYDGRESVLIPRKGSLNNVMFVSTPFWSVDTMFYTKMKCQTAGKYLYFYLHDLDLASMNSGSAVPSMTTEILNDIQIPFPDNAALDIFDEELQSLFDMMKTNENQINHLSSIRDVLLPKLMSGEIDVSTLEIPN